MKCFSDGTGTNVACVAGVKVSDYAYPCTHCVSTMKQVISRSNFEVYSIIHTHYIIETYKPLVRGIVVNIL